MVLSLVITDDRINNFPLFSGIRGVCFYLITVILLFSNVNLFFHPFFHSGIRNFVIGSRIFDKSRVQFVFSITCFLKPWHDPGLATSFPVLTLSSSGREGIVIVRCKFIMETIEHIIRVTRVF